LTTKGWPAIDRVIFGLHSHGQPDQRQVEHGSGQNTCISIVAAGQTPHPNVCPRSIVLRPPLVRVRLVHINASGVAAHLACQRDRSTSMPLPYFQAIRVIPPLTNLCRVRLNTPAARCNQSASAKQQQIAILQIGMGVLQIEPALTLAGMIHDFDFPLCFWVR